MSRGFFLRIEIPMSDAIGRCIVASIVLSLRQFDARRKRDVVFTWLFGFNNEYTRMCQEEHKSCWNPVGRVRGRYRGAGARRRLYAEAIRRIANGSQRVWQPGRLGPDQRSATQDAARDRRALEHTVRGRHGGTQILHYDDRIRKRMDR